MSLDHWIDIRLSGHMQKEPKGNVWKKTKNGDVEIFVKDKRCLISFEDIEFLTWFTFYLSEGYLKTNICGGSYRFHRMLLMPEPHLVVDHINGDTFDNRRENLRVVTRAENTRNRHSVNTPSGVRGVYRKPSGRWVGQTTRNYKQYWTKPCETIEEASDLLSKLKESL